MKRRLGSGRISPPAGFEPATPWSEVGSANLSATRTLHLQAKYIHGILMRQSIALTWLFRNTALLHRLRSSVPANVLTYLQTFVWQIPAVVHRCFKSFITHTPSRFLHPSLSLTALLDTVVNSYRANSFAASTFRIYSAHFLAYQICDTLGLKMYLCFH